MKAQISIRQLFIVIILFFITIPPYLYTNFKFIGLLMALVQYSLFILMFLNIAITKFRGKSPIFWILSLTLILQIISSYRNSLALTEDAIKIAVKTVGCLWFMDMELKHNFHFFIKTFTLYQVVYVIINLLTVIIFPDGMYQSGAYTNCYFLGYDNTHINVQLPAIALVVITSIWKHGKINFKGWTVITIVAISALITFSATSIIGLGIFIIGTIIILPGKKKKHYKFIKVPSPLTTFILFGIISILLIGGSSFGGVKDNLINLFGKDSTLSSRTLLWENSLYYIAKGVLWGYGYESGETVSAKLVNIFGQSGWGVSPHNFYLAVLYSGGIILFITIVCIFIILNYKYFISNNTVEKMIVGLWIFSFMSMCVVESHYGDTIRTLLLFSYYLIECKERKVVNNLSISIKENLK